MHTTHTLQNFCNSALCTQFIWLFLSVPALFTHKLWITALQNAAKPHAWSVGVALNFLALPSHFFLHSAHFLPSQKCNLIYSFLCQVTFFSSRVGSFYVVKPKKLAWKAPSKISFAELWPLKRKKRLKLKHHLPVNLFLSKTRFLARQLCVLSSYMRGGGGRR